MRASQKEIDEKIKELFDIYECIKIQDDKPSHNAQERDYIVRILKILEEGYYAEPLKLEWGSSRGDDLALRAIRYLKGEPVFSNRTGRKSGREMMQKNDIMFSDYQEAKEWAKKNPGKAIIRTSDGTRFKAKP